MAFYKYFWDLANSTAYSDHVVGSFDNNTTTGGGTFKWVSGVNNASLTNIPGVRIKPKVNSSGYWIRVSEGPVCVEWFGPQNATSPPLTFSQLGVSQVTLNSRYGNNFVTTNDTYDTAAVKYAMYYMGTFAAENTLLFEPKLYWITQSIELPKTNTGATGLPGAGGQGKFIIDGNGCTINVYTNGAAFDVFTRVPVDQTEADILVKYSIVFKNFSATNAGASLLWLNTGKSFLFLAASSNAIIENINLLKFDIGLRLEYCPNVAVRNVFATTIKTRAVHIKSGSWFGASLTNSNSDNASLYQVQVEDTYNQIAAITLSGVNNAVVSQFWLKGFGTPSYGIYWDSLNNTKAYNFRITDTIIDTDTTSAGIYVKMQSGGMAIVDGISYQVAQPIVVAEMYSGTGSISVSNSPKWVSTSKFGNIGTVKWEFRNVNFGAGVTTPQQIIDPVNSRWVTGGLYSIPVLGNIVVQSTGSAPYVSLQQVLDYDHNLENNLLFIGTEAGEGSTAMQDVYAIGWRAASYNSANNVVAIGTYPAELNTGYDVTAIGTASASQNTGNGVIAIGSSAADQNTGDRVYAIGGFVGFFGNGPARFNTGDDVVAIGTSAAANNTGDFVCAIGPNAGLNNTLSNVTILSNSFLPSYLNYATALAAFLTGTTGTYLYHDQTTNSIGAVRIP